MTRQRGAAPFTRARIDEPVEQIAESQDDGKSSAREAVERRLEDAETRIRRHQATIEAGADPATLVEAINQAQAD